MSSKNSSYEYQVLNPWSETDPVPLKGIVPRVTDLKDKTIGLFDSHKSGSGAILSVVEGKLREKFPSSKISRYVARFALEEIGPEDRARFEEWVKGVDTVIAAVGD